MIENEFRIVLCDDDSIFMEILAEKIERVLMEQKIPFQLNCYSDSRLMLKDVG